MNNQIIALSRRKHKVSKWTVRRAIARENKVFKSKIGAKFSKEQMDAIRHLTGPEKISAIAVNQGSTKNAVLSAARKAWEAQGYHVREATSGTLESLEQGWKRGQDLLRKNEVLVVHDATLIDFEDHYCRELKRLLAQVEKQNAKLVLVGYLNGSDIAEAISFNAVKNQIGAYELAEMPRQKTLWQRRASVHLAKGQIKKGLEAYAKHNAIQFDSNWTDSILSIAKDYLEDMQKSPHEARLAIAHRWKDVRTLNLAIRSASKLAGNLNEAEYVHKTASGYKTFAAGDRVALEATKEGMLGTVLSVDKESMTILFDPAAGGRKEFIPKEGHIWINYGYAVTAHTAQLTHVDRSYVMATETMDRHLCCMAMNRHQKSAKLYCHWQDFENFDDLAEKLSKERTSECPLDQPKCCPDWVLMPTDRYLALDYYASAIEAQIWSQQLSHHTYPHDILSSKQVMHAGEMLDNVESGLSANLQKIINLGSEIFFKGIMSYAGVERAEYIHTLAFLGGMYHPENDPDREQTGYYEPEMQPTASPENIWPRQPDTDIQHDEPSCNYTPGF